jgi:hypothetical protein
MFIGLILAPKLSVVYEEISGGTNESPVFIVV